MYNKRMIETKEKRITKIILMLSLPLAALTAFASFAGVFLQSTYARETVNWAVQGIGQDIVNLFIVVPTLLIATFYVYRQNKTALMVWSGAVFYLAYSYVIYGFGLHFNNLFIVYCAILGLSVYSFLYFIITYSKQNISGWFENTTPNRTTAIFFFIIAGLFSILWLSEIIPAMLSNSVPVGVADVGLLVNPVHVLDLAICLPALVIIGLLLLKRKAMGYLLAPAMLMFSMLMSTAIFAMVFAMKLKNLPTNIPLSIVFGVLAAISLFILAKFLRKLK